MDKIEQNIIEEDRIWKIPPEIWKIISDYLLPDDAVHLSNTCKELRQKLPFHLKKSGEFIILSSERAYYPWFVTPLINFPISEINIFIAANSKFKMSEIAVWMQIIRNRTVFLETQKYFIRDSKENILIKIKNATKQCEDGDRLCFMAQHINYGFKKSMDCKVCFQVSVQLKMDKYGKVRNRNKVKGYAVFKSPSVFVNEQIKTTMSYWNSWCNLLRQVLGYPLEGNTNFLTMKFLGFISMLQVAFYSFLKLWK